LQIAALIISAISAVIMPIILILLNQRNLRLLEKNKINIEHKVQTYKEIFEIFNAILTKQSATKWDVRTRIDLAVDLIKYAPDEIVIKYIEFWNLAKSGNMSKVDLNPIFRDILLLIRKDLGNHKTKITGTEIIDLLISHK
jgi:hypothetical protein